MGTILKNCTKCNSSYIVYEDVMQSSEIQNQKKYFDELSSMPDRSKITVCAAEVLR